MTFAKLPKISRERLARELTVMVLASYFPSGCSCASGPCGWCDGYERAYWKILRLVERLEKRETISSERRER
jgi:hypothetical protein